MSAPLVARLLAFALAVTATSPVAADPIKRTLPELIQIARERSRGVAQARAERQIRVTQKREALFSWAPGLDFTVGAAPFLDISCQAPLADNFLTDSQRGGLSGEQIRARDCVSTVGQLDAAGNPVPVKTLSLSLLGQVSGAIFQGNVSLTQPLFTFGKIETATQAAGHGIAAADAQVEAQRREVELLATRAYWALKASRAAIATVEDIRERLVPWVHRIEADLEADNPKFTLGDLRRIELGLVEVDLLLADQRRNAAIALHGVHLLAGDDTEIDDGELEVVQIVDQPLEHFESLALANRPELRALDEGVLAYRWLAKYSFSQMLPNLALVLSAGFQQATTHVEDSSSAYQSHINYNMLGAALALRGHFDLAQVARYQHARADTDVIAAQRALARQGYSLEIAQAYNDLVESRRRLELTDQGQRKARGWFTAVDDRLENSTPVELIESAQKYFALRLRYLQAIYETNLNAARLRRASGVDVANQRESGHGD